MQFRGSCDIDKIRIFCGSSHELNQVKKKKYYKSRFYYLYLRQRSSVTNKGMNCVSRLVTIRFHYSFTIAPRI